MVLGENLDKIFQTINLVTFTISSQCPLFFFFFFFSLSIIWLSHGRQLGSLLGQPNSPDVNHCVIQFWPVGHREPRSEIGPDAMAERHFPTLILSQRLNTLGHSPQISMPNPILQPSLHNRTNDRYKLEHWSQCLTSKKVGFELTPELICLHKMTLFFNQRNYILFQLLTLWRLGSIKRSYILKQTWSFQLQVCLSMLDSLVDTRR